MNEEEEEKYADAVAQEQFENALQRGLPYDKALSDGQKAMEAAERHYDEKEGYADAVADYVYSNFKLERILSTFDNALSCTSLESHHLPAIEFYLADTEIIYFINLY